MDPREHARQALERADAICEAVEADRATRDPFYGLEPAQPPLERAPAPIQRVDTGGNRQFEPPPGRVIQGTQEQWDKWVKAHIQRQDKRARAEVQRKFELFAAFLGEHFGTTEKRLTQRLREADDVLRMEIRREAAQAMADHIGPLQEEVKALRRELESVRRRDA